MSRSRKHSPVIGPDSAAQDKRIAAKTERARVRGHLAHERWEDAEVKQQHPWIEWEGQKEWRTRFFNETHRCFCLWQGRWLCQYCRAGGFDAYLRRIMRK